MTGSDVMNGKSNSQQQSDLPHPDHWINSIQRSIFKAIHTPYSGIDVYMYERTSSQKTHARTN